jgi:crotonobetainyl-CoA:carnitine CoA-transferase CaiB-like acyl-CoA transferase
VGGERDHVLSAAAYAARLQSELDARPVRDPVVRGEHPALAWARSGAMALTGHAGAGPLMCPVPLAAAADGVLALLASIAPYPMPRDLDGAQLLGERAAIAGYGRAGDVACGGACRLLRMGAGQLIALNLARTEDFELLPAWLEQDGVSDWESLTAAIGGRRDAAELIARARELGLAIARVDAPHAAPARWFRTVVEGLKGEGQERRRARPRVLDLSALWAGPLCSHLLQLGGAEVIKVESSVRPDGARYGPSAFFDLLNAGKRCVTLDLRGQFDRGRLRALIDDADIVIEASRPRALRQLGIDAEALVRARSGLSWIALSGHGREEPQAQWIAYGDDAAIDAGLARVMREATGEPVFVGDAIADPLAGLHAAVLASWSWQQGGSRLLSISLSECVRHVIEASRTRDWRERCASWDAIRRDAGVPVAGPVARKAPRAASALGADNAAVFDALRSRPC